MSSIYFPLTKLAGPGASATETTSVQAMPVGKPREWSVESFLEVV